MVQAHKWFSLSAMSGNDYALKIVKQVEANMTRKQILEAKGQSKKFHALKSSAAL